MKRFLFPIVFSFLNSGCPPVVQPTPPGATCIAVCINMAKLGCPSARPTAKGASCEDVCNTVQASGIVKWNLACRATAPTCAAADLCEAK
jgi:hypothetical protein